MEPLALLADVVPPTEWIVLYFVLPLAAALAVLVIGIVLLVRWLRRGGAASGPHA